MIFWYEKLISDIRKWFSDIKNSCWFSDIRKSFSDVRKSALKSYLAFHKDLTNSLIEIEPHTAITNQTQESKEKDNHRTEHKKSNMEMQNCEEYVQRYG